MAELRPITPDSVIAPLIVAYVTETGREVEETLMAAVQQGAIGGYTLDTDGTDSVAALLAEEDIDTGTVKVPFYHALEPDADEHVRELIGTIIPKLKQTASRIVSRFQPAHADWALTQYGFDVLERLHMTLDLETFQARVPLVPDGYITRPLVPAHVPDLIVPRIAANAGTLEHQLYPMPRERAEQLLSGYAAGSITPDVDQGATLTAVHTGTPIGAILVQRPSEELGRLVDIFVAPEHQGQGIGRALLISALRALKEGGATEARVETRRQLPAFHLLRQLGFTEADRQPVYFWLSVMGQT